MGVKEEEDSRYRTATVTVDWEVFGVLSQKGFRGEKE